MHTAVETQRVTVRYFNARGRAQFIRYYLSHRGWNYEDHRIPLDPGFEAWIALRDDRTLTGPFQKLPVLEWNGQLVPETLVIRRFLHEASRDAALLSPEDNLRHELLASSVYHDVLMPVVMLIWTDLIYAGVDLPTVCQGALQRLQRYLTTLDRTLTEWEWLERLADRPLMLSDCLLWEELSIAEHVFGTDLRLEATPALERFYRETPGRETFEALLRKQPCQISGRPEEAGALERIRSALGSA